MDLVTTELTVPQPPTPLSLAILIALADRDRHGYAILKEIERQSEGRLSPGTGTLYAALQRLVDEGLIADSPESAEPDDDARRRYYALTTDGREVAREESRRLVRLVEAAEEKKLLPGLRLARPAEEP
jgi:DNA-binding PadR family transcriptional regulator